MCDKHYNTHSTAQSRKGGRLEDGHAHTMDHEQWTRRAFLRTLGLGVASTPFMLGATPVHAIGASAVLSPLAGINSDRILVLIQLEGGNDGLSTVIPVTNDVYYQNRPYLGIPRNETIPLTDDLGLNQYLTNWETYYGDGRLAIVQGVGYGNPNLSHFRSSDIWISGSESTVTESSGWTGRALEQLHPDFLDNPPENPLAVQLGGSSFMFRGRNLNMGMSISSPEIFERLAENGTLHTMDGIPQSRAGEEMRFMRQTVNDSFRYAGAIQTATQNATNAVEYPGGELGENLANVARLIKGGLNTCVYMVTLSGFDTHSEQIWPHGYLMRQLNDSIEAFFQDLQVAGMQERVLAMTFSEFGRTIWENGSGGTDHSTSAPMFMVGSALNGGLFGQTPDLINTDPNGDPHFTVDFRAVYASVLNGWFGVSAADIQAVFGQTFELLPLFNGSAPVSNERPTSITDFSLSGNYPNPFRGTTRIAFDVPDATHVRLSVYDVQGRNMGTLIERTVGSGRHEVAFDGSHLAPGTYFYRLEAAGSSQTKSMVVH